MFGHLDAWSRTKSGHFLAQTVQHTELRIHFAKHRMILADIYFFSELESCKFWPTLLIMINGFLQTTLWLIFNCRVLYLQMFWSYTNCYYHLYNFTFEDRSRHSNNQLTSSHLPAARKSHSKNIAMIVWFYWPTNMMFYL